jgi:phospholipase D1/2
MTIDPPNDPPPSATSPPTRSSRGRWSYRIIGAVALAALIACVAYASQQPAVRGLLEAAFAFMSELKANEWNLVLIPATFIVAGFALVPVTLLVALTTAVFGPLAGAALGFAGAMSSAAAGYAAGRWLGRDFVRRIAGRRFEDLSRRLARRGTLSMLLIRLVPIAPYMVVNFAAGASPLGWRDYLLGTGLGLQPGVILTAAFVDRALAAVRNPNLFTWVTLAIVLLVIAAATYAVQRKVRRMNMPDAPATEDAMKDASQRPGPDSTR